MNPNSDQLDRIKQANLSNIVKKVASGKTLTAAEMRTLEERSQQAPADADETNTAPSWPKLAAALGCSRQQLGAWRRVPGSPIPHEDGSHDVAKWKAFLALHGFAGRSDPNGETDPVLRSRKLKAEVLQREIRVQIMQQDLIPVTEVRERIGYHIGQAQMLMRNKLENELPPQLVNKSAVDMRKIISTTLYEVFDLLNKAQYDPPKR